MQIILPTYPILLEVSTMYVIDNLFNNNPHDGVGIC